jgi:excisionase family DNA binding protein
MTTHEACARLGVKRSWLCKLIRSKRLPAVKVGRDWRIEPEALAALERRPRKKPEKKR